MKKNLSQLLNRALVAKTAEITDADMVDGQG